MSRFHAAGICDCCDGPPESEPDENPNYGPGNPDWERDFERDAYARWLAASSISNEDFHAALAEYDREEVRQIDV